ncbi:MAG: nucleotide pyrophosphohydrolase [Phototrophicaceae bacterium]
MDIKDLETAMHKFVEDMGWYADDSSKPQSPKNLAISLVLEAGEVLEHFQWGDDVKDKEAFAEELADVMLYLLQIASITDVDLSDAVTKKLKRNYTRDWENE